MTLIGWCPGLRQVAEMLNLYAGTSAVRLFYGFRDPVPTVWAGEDLGPLAPEVLPILSFKVWDLPAMLRLADVAPPGTVLTYHHEDEQQDGGDIPPALFVSRWVELARAFATHPRRGLLRLVPIYTRYWWEKNPGDLRYWPAEVAHLLDAVGWDIYNNGTSYRSPDDLLRVPREMAARTGLPYLIGELGAVRLAGDDGGAGRSAWMRAMVTAARQDGALAVCWFHRDEWDLTGPASAAEQQTWRELIREATVVWSKGSPWRTVRSLDRLNEQIRAAYPRAVPPATDPNSWGSLADDEHSTSSDHFPHYFTVLGKVAVVTARDFPHAPDLGLDFGEVAEALRLSRDPRIKYVIFDGRMFSSYPANGYAPFTWRPYSGPDMHRTHGHVSSVATAAADDPRDWQIGEDDSMDRTEFIEHFKAAMNDPTVAALMKARPWQYPVTEKASALNVLFAQQLPQLAAAVKGVGEAMARESANPDEIRALLAELPKPEPVDEQAIVAGVLAGLPPEKIAAAIPPELAKAVADELATRLAS